MYRSYKGVYELIGRYVSSEDQWEEVMVLGLFTDQNECNGERGVSYYTMLGKHLSWIVQNTKDACYCYKS